MVKAYDEINKLHRKAITAKVKWFVNNYGQLLRNQLYGNTDLWAKQARQATYSYDNFMKHLEVSSDGLDGA